jgi:hypothetical protein
MKVLRVLLKARSQYAYVFTVENDFNSFAVAFWQTVLGMRRPRHVILSFIMRERTTAVSSRAKYALMRFLFRSVHKAICSARLEADYYADVFRWTHGKAQFVPLATSTSALSEPVADEGYIFTGGRVYRDYDTLMRALDGSEHPLVVVSEKDDPAFVGRDRVDARFQIPVEEFNSLMAKSRIVVVPLEDRRFSVGQTVILQAMAMGKAVVATRTAATLDYIAHLQTGILVSPRDHAALRQVIDQLMSDKSLREQLGRNAKAHIEKNGLPLHYARSVRYVLASGD